MNRSQTRTCSKPQCSAAASNHIKCSRCHSVYYCVRKHQFADLKRHKAQCANPASATVPPPAANAAVGVADEEQVRTVDVVLFPASGLPACIISMECFIRNNRIYHGLKEEWLDLREYIDSPRITSVAIGPIRRSARPHSRLYLAWNDSAWCDGSAINYCVRRYTQGHHQAIWHGNLIGYRAREPTRKHMEYIDITDKDIAMFAAFFTEHKAQEPTEVPDTVVRHFYD